MKNLILSAATIAVEAAKSLYSAPKTKSGVMIRAHAVLVRNIKNVAAVKAVPGNERSRHKPASFLHYNNSC